MRTALGLRAHSGWAALVAIGNDGGGPRALDRRRLDLVAPADMSWAKQPYHAAEDQPPAEAAGLVARAIASADRLAASELGTAVERLRAAGHEPAAAGLLVGEPMPAWSVAEILAVHARMHRAEGVLFREALARAASALGLALVTVREKGLETPTPEVAAGLAALGRELGPPWGKDQKDAARAAMLALDQLPA